MAKKKKIVRRRGKSKAKNKGYFRKEHQDAIVVAAVLRAVARAFFHSALVAVGFCSCSREGLAAEALRSKLDPAERRVVEAVGAALGGAVFVGHFAVAAALGAGYLVRQNASVAGIDEAADDLGDYAGV